MAQQAAVKIGLCSGSLRFAWDGINPCLKEEPFCFHCKADAQTQVGISLLRCSRCKLVYYCSKACQKLDFGNHNGCCKLIDEYSKTMELQHHYLSTLVDANGEVVNCFEERTGLFLLHVETQDYVASRFKLARDIKSGIVDQNETREGWEVVTHHFQEVLRLETSDCLNVRLVFPITLLHLNRDDDDAFVFCRHWCIGDTDDWDTIHGDSKEGDWIYGHEKDARYLDFFEECAPALPKTMSLAMLVAIALIKIRLVVAHQYRMASVMAFSTTSVGDMLQSVLPEIKAMCVGDPSHCMRMEAQQAQLDRLLDEIDAHNPSMLPSLLNPAPFNNQKEPPDRSAGHPSDAKYAMNVCYKLWHQTPGATAILESRYGPHPTYNSNLQM